MTTEMYCSTESPATYNTKRTATWSSEVEFSAANS